MRYWDTDSQVCSGSPEWTKLHAIVWYVVNVVFQNMAVGGGGGGVVEK